MRAPETSARRAGWLSLGHLAEDAERIGRRRLRLDCELRQTGAGKRRQSDLAFEKGLLQSDLLLLAGEPRNLDIDVGALVKRALLEHRLRLLRNRARLLQPRLQAGELARQEGLLRKQGANLASRGRNPRVELPVELLARCLLDRDAALVAIENREVDGELRAKAKSVAREADAGTVDDNRQIWKLRQDRLADLSVLGAIPILQCNKIRAPVGQGRQLAANRGRIDARHIGRGHQGKFCAGLETEQCIELVPPA